MLNNDIETTDLPVIQKAYQATEEQLFVGTIKQWEEKGMSYVSDLRPFKESDWEAFSGATEFKDGSQPLIADNHATYLFVADENGITVFNSDADQQPLLLPMHIPNDRIAEFIVCALPSRDEPDFVEQLFYLGFVRA